MVTDHIERFVEEGLQLRSGEILPADIIVTATGMRMKIMDGVEHHRRRAKLCNWAIPRATKG